MPQPDVIPTSASIASPGLGIRYIGNHAYAYNIIAVSTTPVTHLDFTTGAGYIIGKFQCNGAADMDNVGRGQETVFQIKLNGVTILQLKTSSETDDNNPTVYNEILVPPLTHLQMVADSDAANFGFTSVAFVGRVYGAE